MWAAAGDTVLLFDAKLQWVKKKRLVLEKEKMAVMSMILHNSKVWLGTNQGLVTVNPDDMSVMNYFPEKVLLQMFLHSNSRSLFRTFKLIHTFPSIGWLCDGYECSWSGFVDMLQRWFHQNMGRRNWKVFAFHSW
jgi:hypothetical protein